MPASTCHANGKRSKPRLELVKRLSANEIAAGATPRIYPQEWVKKTGASLHTMMLGFMLHFTVQIDVVAASLAAAIPGRRFFAMHRAFNLTTFGRPLFGDGLDGRRLRDKMLIQVGSLPMGDPSTIADTDATNDIYNVRLFYTFAPTVWTRQQEERKRDGAIPLAAFGADDVLSWTVQNSLDGLTGGAITGLTVDGIQSENVYAILRDDEKPECDALSFLEEVNTAETQFSISRKFGDRPGVLESATLRHMDEDTSGLPLGTEYSGINVAANGDAIYRNLSMVEAREHSEGLYRLSGGADGDRTTYGVATPFGAAASGFLNLVPYHPGMERADMADTPIRIDLSRATRPNTRILMHSWAAPDMEWKERLAEALDIAPGAMRREMVDAKNVAPEVLPWSVENAPKAA